MLRQAHAVEAKEDAMPRFLIEIRHDDDYEGCIKALDALAKYGSHLVSHAEFGCGDGVHCGWLQVEVGSRGEAEQIVPPQFREGARIIQLKTWKPEEITAMVETLGA